MKTFNDLAPELRIEVYRRVLVYSSPIIITTSTEPHMPNLLLASKRIRAEALQIYLSENTFEFHLPIFDPFNIFSQRPRSSPNKSVGDISSKPRPDLSKNVKKYIPFFQRHVFDSTGDLKEPRIKRFTILQNQGEELVNRVNAYMSFLRKGSFPGDWQCCIRAARQARSYWGFDVTLGGGGDDGGESAAGTGVVVKLFDINSDGGKTYYADAGEYGKEIARREREMKVGLQWFDRMDLFGDACDLKERGVQFFEAKEALVAAFTVASSAV